MYMAMPLTEIELFNVRRRLKVTRTQRNYGIALRSVVPMSDHNDLYLFTYCGPDTLHV